MGKIGTPERVKLIAGLISNNTKLLSDIRRPFERILANSIDFESPVIEFDKTDYYQEEMGPALKRKFYSFKKLVSLDGIHAVKIKTNALEKRFTKLGKRRVNIDPGYIDMAKLVLFSTKDYTHRIHISKGIYAEVTLHYKNGSFTAWPWTYPDYRTKEYLDIMHKIREIYKEQLRAS